MKKFLLIFAWIWIAVPLGWGVYQSVQKSMPLFDSQPDAIAYSPEFAQRVIAAWAALEIPRVEIPSVACITRTLHVLYQASFPQEEGEAVRCRWILADPSDWRQGEGSPTGFHVLRFAESHAFTPKEIRKLAPAASFFRSIPRVDDDAEKAVSI